MKYWRRVLYWVGILIGGGLFTYQLILVSERLQTTPLAFVDARYVILASILISLATFIQVFAWSTLIRSLGVKLSFRNLYCAYVLPFLARYLPGSVWGYIGRSLWLKQQHQISEDLTNISTALELVSLVVSAGVILVVSNLLLDTERLMFFWISLVAGLIFLGGLILLLLPRFAQLHLPLFRNITLEIRGLAFSLCLHCLLWVLQGFGLYFLLSTFVVIPVEFFLETIRVFIVAWAIGFIVPFIPAGLGIRDLALANLVEDLGISYYVSSILALASRFLMLLTEFFFVIIALILVRQKK